MVEFTVNEELAKKVFSDPMSFKFRHRPEHRTRSAVMGILNKYLEQGILKEGDEITATQLADVLWDDPARAQLWPTLPRHRFSNVLGLILTQLGLKTSRLGTSKFYKMPAEAKAYAEPEVSADGGGKCDGEPVFEQPPKSGDTVTDPDLAEIMKELQQD
jgi:hypothetical protein